MLCDSVRVRFGFGSFRLDTIRIDSVRFGSIRSGVIRFDSFCFDFFSFLVVSFCFICFVLFLLCYIFGRSASRCDNERDGGRSNVRSCFLAPPSFACLMHTSTEHATLDRPSPAQQPCFYCCCCCCSLRVGKVTFTAV